MKDIGSIWNKWDLHIHSDASDGKMNCQEIIDKAKEEKLSVIALYGAQNETYIEG